MSTKHQIHQSGIGMMERCGESWRRRYIEGEKRPPAAAMLVGTGLDRSVRGNLDTKIRTGELLPIEAVKDIARDAIGNEAMLQEWEPRPQDEARFGEGKRQFDVIVDQTVTLAETHATALAPTLSPTHVAQEFVLDIAGYDYQLVGENDIREETRGLVGIRDTKRRKNKPNQFDVDSSTQLTTYALAEFIATGKMPDYLTLDCVRPLARGPKIDIAWSYRTKDDFDVLLRRVQHHIESIEKGHFAPAEPSMSWWCSPDWCGYYRDCPYTRNPEHFGPPPALVQIQQAAAPKPEAAKPEAPKPEAAKGVELW